MSEEFDKEAEREKLREKYEKDEQKRKETQRMSELLLQGATMTNEHCGNCGDPLFRDGGETFCPTCGGERAAAAEGDDTTEQSQQQTAEQSQQPSGQHQPPQQASQSAEDSQPQATEEQANGTTPAEQSSRSQVNRHERPASTERQSVPERTIQSPPSTGEDPRAELQRAVTRAARKANEATDPRTAKQWLEASKEAAEALEALER